MIKYIILLLWLFIINTSSVLGQDLREQLRIAENSAAIQKDKVLKRDKEIETKNEEITQLQKENATIKAKNKANEELTVLVEKRRIEVLELNSYVATLEKLRDTLQKENEGLKQTNGDLIAQNTKLNEENRSLKEHNRQLLYENDSLKFVNNLKIVGKKCIEFDKNSLDFSFVLTSNAASNKSQEVTLLIAITKKETQNNTSYRLTTSQGQEYIEMTVKTDEQVSAKFESLDNFSTKNDLLRLRYNNYRILFYQKGDESRKIIGEIEIINLENFCNPKGSDKP